MLKEGIHEDLVSVRFSPFSLLEESPYEGVYDIRLVLLQPVAGPGNNVETEMVPNVQAASLCHLLLQERIPLSPEQQHRRPDMVVAQGQGAEDRVKQIVKNLLCEKFLKKNTSTQHQTVKSICINDNVH